MRTLAALALTFALAVHAAADSLHDAAARADHRTIRNLLDAGADPYGKDGRGMTPISANLFPCSRMPTIACESATQRAGNGERGLGPPSVVSAE